MGDMDVFDEWGNFVGRFTPAAGAGAGTGCLILLIIGIGFFIFMLIKGMIQLIEEGFKYAKKGEWRKALLIWAIPALIVGTPVVCLVGLVSTAAASSIIVRENERRVDEEFKTRIEQGTLIELRRIRGGIPATEAGCQTSSCKAFVYGEYEIQNMTNSVQLTLLSSWWSCDLPNVHLAPHEKIRIYCAEQNSPINSPSNIGVYGPARGGWLQSGMNLEIPGYRR